MKAQSIHGSMTDFAKSLWDMANGIVAFSVVQAIAFLYKLDDDSFVQEVSDSKAQCIVIIMIVLMMFLSILAIYCVHRLATRQNPEAEARRIWRDVSRGRATAVTIFNLLCLGSYCFAISHYDASSRFSYFPFICV